MTNLVSENLYPAERTLKKYGLRLLDWTRLWYAGDGRCPICRKRFSRSRLPCVDHRHKDGLVRGLVCSPCNNWLGEMHDDAGRLERAASYLTDPPAVHVLGERFVPDSSGAAR